MDISRKDLLWLYMIAHEYIESLKFLDIKRDYEYIEKNMSRIIDDEFFHYPDDWEPPFFLHFKNNIESWLNKIKTNEEDYIVNPYETLKMIIEIFEKASSTRDGLYKAQNYIFEKHPDLELGDDE